MHYFRESLACGVPLGRAVVRLDRGSNSWESSLFPGRTGGGPGPVTFPREQGTPHHQGAAAGPTPQPAGQGGGSVLVLEGCAASFQLKKKKSRLYLLEFPTCCLGGN